MRLLFCGGFTGLLSVIILTVSIWYVVVKKIQQGSHVDWVGKRLKIKDSRQLQPLLGPESLILYNNPAIKGQGSIFTGTGDGKLVECSVSKGLIRTVFQPDDFYRVLEIYQASRPDKAEFERRCLNPISTFDTAEENEIYCGRLLGMKWISKSAFYMVNTYLGIFSHDILDESLDLVMPRGSHMFLNDVEKVENLVFYTVSSTNNVRKDYLEIIFKREETGQLRSYNLKTKEDTLILDNLAFANGICRIGRKLYVVNMMDYSILEYSLDTNSARVLISNLPLFPDNIRTFNDTQLIVTGYPRSPFLNLLHSLLPPFGLEIAFDVLKRIPHYKELLDLLKRKIGMVLIIDATSGNVSYSVEDKGCKHFCGRSEAQLSPQTNDCKSIYCHSMFFGTVIHTQLTELRFQED